MTYEHDPWVRDFPELRFFWERSEHGQLVLPRCPKCAKLHWFPRPHCPFCHASNIEWIEASGRGTVFSFSVLKLATPVVMAYVQLAEGPLLMTNLRTEDPGRIAIGTAVDVHFERSSIGRNLPFFSPLSIDER
jgi:uncharacterized OB-fold protein